MPRTPDTLVGLMLNDEPLAVSFAENKRRPPPDVEMEVMPPLQRRWRGLDYRRIQRRYYPRRPHARTFYGVPRRYIPRPGPFS